MESAHTIVRVATSLLVRLIDAIGTEKRKSDSAIEAGHNAGRTLNCGSTSREERVSVSCTLNFYANSNDCVWQRVRASTGCMVGRDVRYYEVVRDFAARQPHGGAHAVSCTRAPWGPFRRVGSAKFSGSAGGAVTGGNDVEVNEARLWAGASIVPDVLSPVASLTPLASASPSR